MGKEKITFTESRCNNGQGICKCYTQTADRDTTALGASDFTKGDLDTDPFPVSLMKTASARGYNQSFLQSSWLNTMTSLVGPLPQVEHVEPQIGCQTCQTSRKPQAFLRIESRRAGTSRRLQASAPCGPTAGRGKTTRRSGGAMFG